MWRALRAELAYSRPYLLGGLGLAAGVAVLITVIFAVVRGDVESHVGTGLRAMFLMMAPLIVGIVVQVLRAEECRARLLLAGSLTPRQIAVAGALLPVALCGIGILAAALVITAEALLTGRFEGAALNLVGFVGGQLFAYGQMGPLVREAVAAHGQRRRRAAVAGWGGFVLAVVLLAGSYLALAQELLTWNHLIAAHLIVAVAAGAASVELYAGRTDFTR